MQIKINSNILRDGLNKVLSVVDKKNSRPILSNCLVKASAEHIQIIATDLEVAAKILLPAQVDEIGTFCLNTKNVFDIVRELPDDEVHLKLDHEKNLLDISCQKINYSLLITSAEDYPQTNFESSGKTFELSSKNILNIINKISHSVSTDETRINLNGIYLQQLDAKLRAVAIDGHRLALLDIADAQVENQSLTDGVIVPKKGIFELKKIAESATEKSLKISLDDSFLYVNLDNKYYLSVRLIAREYPKYQTVIPAKTTQTLMADRNLLLNAVKRIRILSNEKTNGIKIGLSNSQIEVSANHPSLGHAKEIIPADYQGEVMEIGFNAKYVVDVLTVLDSDDVTFELNNELSPVIVKADKFPDFLGIIMPLKI